MAYGGACAAYGGACMAYGGVCMAYGEGSYGLRRGCMTYGGACMAYGGACMAYGGVWLRRGMMAYGGASQSGRCCKFSGNEIKGEVIVRSGTITVLEPYRRKYARRKP